MSISAIQTDDEYTSALREIERLWGSEEGTPEGDRLNRLVTLVESYESERWADALKVPNSTTRAAMDESRAILRARRNRSQVK